MDKIRKSDFGICSAKAFIEGYSRMTLYCIMEQLLEIHCEKCRRHIFAYPEMAFAEKVTSNLFSQICMS